MGRSGFKALETVEDVEQCGSYSCCLTSELPIDTLDIFTQNDLILLPLYFLLGPKKTPTNHLGFCLLIFLMVEEEAEAFRAPRLYEHRYNHLT